MTRAHLPLAGGAGTLINVLLTRIFMRFAFLAQMARAAAL